MLRVSTHGVRQQT